MLRQINIMKNFTNNNDFDFIPNIPTLGLNDRKACISFMFYDSDDEISRKWIDWLESLFLKLRTEPDNLLLHRDGKTRKGKYSRLRKALISAVEESSIDFQLRSPKREGLYDFFPSEVSVSINTSGPGQAQGVISVIEEKVPNIYEFANEIASDIVPLTGNFYGHCSRFPALLGPDAYAAAVGAIPKGWDFKSTQPYTERLTNWRKKTQFVNGVAASFREIFPINFLKQSHLENNILGKPARLFYETYGKFLRVSPNSEQYMWVVPNEKLEFLRKILEEDHLILSSN